MSDMWNCSDISTYRIAARSRPILRGRYTDWYFHRIGIWQTTIDELLSANKGGSNHRESGTYGTHTAGKHKCRMKRIRLFDDTKIRIEVIILRESDCTTSSGNSTSIGLSGEIGILGFRINLGDERRLESLPIILGIDIVTIEWRENRNEHQHSIRHSS